MIMLHICYFYFGLFLYLKFLYFEILYLEFSVSRIFYISNFFHRPLGLRVREVRLYIVYAKLQIHINIFSVDEVLKVFISC